MAKERLTRAEKCEYLKSIATEDELNLVFGVCGYSHKTLDKILQVRTGIYADFETFINDDEWYEKLSWRGVV